MAENLRIDYDSHFMADLTREMLHPMAEPLSLCAVKACRFPLGAAAKVRVDDIAHLFLAQR